MKIRNLLLLATVVVFGFTACDLEDLGTTSVNTDLSVDMPLEGASKKSADEVYSFNGSGSIDLASEPDVKSHIENLKDLSAKGGKFVVNHLPDTLKIYSITASVTVDGNTKQIGPYESEEGYANGSIVEVLPGDVGNVNSALGLLKPNFDKVISFTVTGSANQDMQKYVGETVRPSITLVLETSLEVGL